MVLEGRRYRLVPIEEASARRAAENDAPPRPLAVDVLTARERQIVEHVALGQVNKEIAAALHISSWTVSTHLRRIFAKLHVDTRAAMVFRYLQR